MKKLIAFIIAGTAALAVFAATRGKTSLSSADILPPGALMYAEIADTDAMIDRWRKSGMRERLEESEFYSRFKNRHLAARLIARFDEAESALGFAPDLDMLATIADGPVAAALYDVGRMEFVVTMRMSGESSAATAFGEAIGAFESIEYRGAKIYRREFSVARGREKMIVLFAVRGDRMIVSTSEKLLRAAIDNLSGKRAGRGLAATKSFRDLVRFANKESLCSLWLDLEKLRRDSYFRRYFVGADSPDSQTTAAVRSEIVEIENGFSELRYASGRDIASRGLQRNIGDLIPAAAANAPFIAARTVSSREAAGLVMELAGIPKTESDAVRSNERLPYVDWDESSYYEYPSPEFDDAPVAIEFRGPESPVEIISGQFAPYANPAVFVEWPVVTRGLAGFANRRAVAFDRRMMVRGTETFERDLATVLNREFAAGADAFNWRESSVGELKIRELRSPVAERAVFLFADRKRLILATNAELIPEMLAGNDEKRFDYDEFVSIETAPGREVFNAAFGSVAAREFGGSATDLHRELESMFAVFSDIRRFEITKKSEDGLERSAIKVIFE